MCWQIELIFFFSFSLLPKITLVRNLYPFALAACTHYPQKQQQLENIVRQSVRSVAVSMQFFLSLCVCFSVQVLRTVSRPYLIGQAANRFRLFLHCQHLLLAPSSISLWWPPPLQLLLQWPIFKQQNKKKERRKIQLAASAGRKY